MTQGMSDPDRIRKLVEAADPEAIKGINQAAVAVSKLVSQSIDKSGILNSIAKINESALAGLKVMPKFEVPTLNLDYSSLLPDMPKVNESIMKSLAPAFTDFNKRYFARFDEIAKNLQKIAARAYPPNWRIEDGLVPFPDTSKRSRSSFRGMRLHTGFPAGSTRDSTRSSC